MWGVGATSVGRAGWFRAASRPRRQARGAGEVKRPGSAVTGQLHGDLQPTEVDGATGTDGAVGQPDQLGPAQQVVRERAEHGPRTVSVELARGEVRERLILETGHHLFHDCVDTMLGLEQ